MRTQIPSVDKSKIATGLDDNENSIRSLSMSDIKK
jgi:hypothetical protein